MVFSIMRKCCATDPKRRRITCDCGCGDVWARCGYNIDNYPNMAPLQHSDYCPCGGDWSLCGDNPDNYPELSDDDCESIPEIDFADKQFFKEG